MKATDISNSYYESEHGKAPRGEGSWAFGSYNPTTKQYDVVYWAKGVQLLSTAKQEAAQQANANGYTKPLYVMP